MKQEKRLKEASVDWWLRQWLYVSHLSTSVAMSRRSLLGGMMGGRDPFDDDFFRDPFMGMGADPFMGMGGGMMMLEGPRGGSGGGGGGGGRRGGSMMQGMQMGFPGFGGGNSSVMMNMSSMGGGSSMVVSSSSFSMNGREVQSSSTTARMGPGGVAEIQSQHRDGSGQERIMMERRVGERARRVEKTYNARTGEEETQDNTYGIEDGQEDLFDHEFQQAMAASSMRGSGGRSLLGGGGRSAQGQQAQIGYGDYGQRQQRQQHGVPSHPGSRSRGFRQ